MGKNKKVFSEEKIIYLEKDVSMNSEKMYSENWFDIDPVFFIEKRGSDGVKKEFPECGYRFVFGNLYYSNKMSDDEAVDLFKSLKINEIKKYIKYFEKALKSIENAKVLSHNVQKRNSKRNRKTS